MKLAATKAFGLFAMMVASVPAALAEWELNMPVGVTPVSRDVYGLHMLIFGICVAIAVAVFGVMIYSIFTHRKSKGQVPATFSHSTKAEIIWTLIPFAILVFMAVPSAETLIKIEDTSAADMTVKVTGYQWRWRYDYLDEGFGFFSNLSETSNAARQLDSGIDVYEVENYLLDVDNPLVVPVGTKVRTLITGSDVIHGWWVPAFGGKKDAIPGFVNEFWFQADEPGIYRGQCAELCGKDHGFMPVVVEVLPQAEYDAWVKTAKVDFSKPEIEYERDYEMAELMAQGEKSYGTFCAACHQANGQGLPAAGFPSLIGAPSVMADTADEHIDIILNGRQGTAMAAFGGQLDDLDIAAIITYERNAWGIESGDIVQPRMIRDKR